MQWPLSKPVMCSLPAASGSGTLHIRALKERSPTTVAPPSEEVRSPKPITDILDLAARTLGHDVTPKTACGGKRTRVAQNMRDTCRRFYEVEDFDVSQAKLPADIQADEALADYEIAVGDGFIRRSAPVFRMRFCVICHVPG